MSDRIEARDASAREASGRGDGFPSDFTWGASTSAYQIEGGMALDGGGTSIWDIFASTPGNVRGGANGRVAVDHRGRMAEDVALMADLGISAYRFSVSWPRVQPSGKGPANQAGLDFYRALVDELVSHDIEPVATLYHWDLPQELEDAGGWPARDTASRFGDYAAMVGQAIGDHVVRWSTLNEPWCAAFLGYASGVHAPGRTDPVAAVAAAHHLLLAHGIGVDALRSEVADSAVVGLTVNPYPVVAAGDRPEDHDAARRVDGIANRIWYDPVLRGRYPDDVVDDLLPLGLLAVIQDGDLDQISRPIDGLGLNYYRRHHVRHRTGASRSPSEWVGSDDIELVEPPGPHTDGGWAIEPDGLAEVLHAAAAYDPPPLWIDECGAAFRDVVDADGTVHDTGRTDFLARHVDAARAAVDAGVDLRGFFAWSLLDNFEWAEGYAHRFGIVHIDFATLERTPKASARWYAEQIGAHRSR